eukprot:scaffold97625_cov51-Cyclotella_meneghiniana.AAC.5
MAVIPLTSLAFNWRRLEMSKAMKQSWDWDGTKQTDGHVLQSPAHRSSEGIFAGITIEEFI